MEIHNLRNYQLPRAEQGEEAALAMEAKRLFSFVGMLLRQWFAAVRRPLAESMPGFRALFIIVYASCLGFNILNLFGFNQANLH